ncbi:MAG: hypothetical protein WB239_00220, partial [Acidimicrobiia bacterium]
MNIRRVRRARTRNPSSTTYGYISAATDLAHFVLALREVPTANAPTTGNYRAFGLAGVDADFRDWL